MRTMWLVMALSLGGAALQMTREASVRLATSTLAAEIDVPEDELYARRVEPAEWPDAGLGCPGEGESYAAGAVSGYRIWFRSGRQLYRVHVGDGRAVVCGDSERPRSRRQKPPPERVDAPPEPEPVIGEVPEDVLDAIREDLLERIDAPADAIELTRAEARTWNDGSLGCPEPGMTYPQSLVDGYWVVFEHGERPYDYRATKRGYFKLCEPPVPLKR